MTRLRELPCAVLLAVQGLGVLLYPFLDGAAGRQLFALFGVVVLTFVVLAVRVTPGVTWVAAALCVPAIGLLLAQIITGNPEVGIWASGVEAVAYAYACSAMLRYMLDDDKVTTDELFAMGTVFTLGAWAFAHTFVVLQAVEPAAFGADRNWMELLFLSFTTLSSTGLSDIVPVTGHARSIVMIEQVAGVFYVAMVVTRLVGIRAGR